MKDITKLAVAFIASAPLLFVGCGGTPYTIAPVSGKVTSDGAPVASLRLIFTPMPNSADTDPGPWSTAVTNAQGEYTLATRHDVPGASVGKHTVSFEYEEGEDLEGLEEDLEAAMEEEGSAEEVADLQKRITAAREARKGRPKVSEDFWLEFEVPTGGTKEANFELPK